MKQVQEININNEKIFLRKDFLGWHIVNPIKINGKINWKNLIAGGSWIKLILVFLFILILLGAIKEYSSAANIANQCLNKSAVIVNLPYG